MCQFQKNNHTANMLAVRLDNHGWNIHRWRPYRVECAGSLPTSEVKRRRARLVLGWGTAREDLRVLPACFHVLPRLSLFFCAWLRVWRVLGANVLYILCCMFVCCCFGCCCGCGQYLHVSLPLCVFCCSQCAPKHHICANLHRATT